MDTLTSDSSQPPGPSSDLPLPVAPKVDQKDTGISGDPEALANGGSIVWKTSDGGDSTKGLKRERPAVKRTVPLEGLKSEHSNSQSTRASKRSKKANSDSTDDDKPLFKLPKPRRMKHLPKHSSKRQAPTSRKSSAPKEQSSPSSFTSFGTPVGNAKSSDWRRRLKAALKSGALDPTDDPERLQAYEEKILLYDSHARFKYNREDWEVFHSVCGKWYLMKEGYNTSRFTEHCEKCIVDVTKPIKRATIIEDYFLKGAVRGSVVGGKNKSGEKAHSSRGDEKEDGPASQYGNSPDSEVRPCRGLTADVFPHLESYLNRATSDGGGSQSRTKIAQALFNKEYCDLSDNGKKEVDLQRHHERTWEVSNTHNAIFSTACLKTVCGPEYPTKYPELIARWHSVVAQLC